MAAGKSKEAVVEQEIHKIEIYLDEDQKKGKMYQKRARRI